MKIITIPRLRLAQWQTLTEASIKICKNLNGIEKAYKAVVSIFNPFKEAMLKDKASGDEKQVIDKSRDKLTSGFFDQVYAEVDFPHKDENVRENLSELVSIIDKYGYKINKLPYNEQTAMVDNLLAEIKNGNFSALEPTQLLKWVPYIQQANNDFKAASKSYISDLAEDSANEAASSLVPELRAALEGLFIMLFAQIQVSPSDDLIKAYAELETLVNSMK